MEVCIIPVSPPGFLSIPVRVSLFLVFSPCFSLPQPVCVCLHQFLLCQFLISCSKRVYSTSRKCIQYSKIASTQSRWERKGKPQSRVRNETNTKLQTMKSYSQAVGAINILHALQQSFQRQKYNSVSMRSNHTNYSSFLNLHNLWKRRVTMTQLSANSSISQMALTHLRSRNPWQSSLTFPGWKHWFPSVLNGSISSHSS